MCITGITKSQVSLARIEAMLVNLQDFDIHHDLISNIIRVDLYTADSRWLNREEEEEENGMEEDGQSVGQRTISPRSSF